MSRQIAETPELRLELQHHMPAITRAAKTRAGPQGVRAVIGKAFALYRQPERSEAEWTAWWEVHDDVLSDVPWTALEAAMSEWTHRPDADFLPKPGLLRQMALETPTEEAMAYHRANLALTYRKPFLPPPSEPVKVDPVEMKRLNDEHDAAVAAAKTQARMMRDGGRPAYVFKPAATDEKGVTPQMRALLAKQRERAGGPA